MPDARSEHVPGVAYSVRAFGEGRLWRSAGLGTLLLGGLTTLPASLLAGVLFSRGRESIAP